MSSDGIWFFSLSPYGEIGQFGLSDCQAHTMWLEASLYTFRRFDEKLFDVKRCENDYRVFWDALNTEEDLLRISEPSVFEDIEESCEAIWDEAKELPMKAEEVQSIDSIEEELLEAINLQYRELERIQKKFSIAGASSYGIRMDYDDYYSLDYSHYVSWAKEYQNRLDEMEEDKYWGFYTYTLTKDNMEQLMSHPLMMSKNALPASRESAGSTSAIVLTNPEEFKQFEESRSRCDESSKGSNDPTVDESNGSSSILDKEEGTILNLDEMDDALFGEM